MDGNILVLGGVAPISLQQDEGGGGGGGGEAVLIDKTITANGTYRASADGADGYKKVIVDVSASPDLQSKTVTISENGTTTVTPDTGKDGLSSVLIDVDVSPVLQSKSVSITSNGTTTVSPDSGKDGLSSVTVTANVNPPLMSAERTITANGSTTVMPPSGAYGLSAVLINTEVPNSYAAADEGKVVSNGALVAQSSDSTTANGTFDTTLINSFTVNVSGGGGTPTYGLINTFSITEAVSLITIPLSDLVKADGKLCLSCESVTFSQNDYLYLKIGSSTSSRGIYRGSSGSANFNSMILFAPSLTLDSKTFNGFIYSYSGWTNSGGGAAPVVSTMPDNLYLMLGNSSRTFTGGTIKVYGRTA